MNFNNNFIFAFQKLSSCSLICFSVMDNESSTSNHINVSYCVCQAIFHSIAKLQITWNKCCFSVTPLCARYRIFSNLIRTSFCRFLKRKKKLVRGSNPNLSFNCPLPTRQTDWILLDVTTALTIIQLTRHVWSGHLTASGTNAPQLISVAAI